MSAPLTVHNAQITTAAVEVKTLTITGKQVTLAVFRQLHEQPLLPEDGDGTFVGIPWGTVNYHPDKCSGDRSHLHVVWQEGDQLRRSKVMVPRWEAHWADSHDDFIQATFCLNDHSLPGWAKRKGYRSSDDVEFTWEGIRCVSNPPDYGHSRYPEDSDVPQHYHRRDSAPERECMTQDDYNRLHGEVAEGVADEKARRNRWRTSYESLANLPQLFIAV